MRQPRGLGFFLEDFVPLSLLVSDFTVISGIDTLYISCALVIVSVSALQGLNRLWVSMLSEEGISGIGYTELVIVNHKHCLVHDSEGACLPSVTLPCTVTLRN